MRDKNDINTNETDFIRPCKEYFLTTINNMKVGFMGLMEEDCLMLQTAVDINRLKYICFIQKAKELVKLFQNENCELIIALTHMRQYNEV